MARSRKTSERTYEGRFKGSTETHMPNDKFREVYDTMKWDCFEEVICRKCGHTEMVHKLEVKIYRCSSCGEL